MLRLSMSLHRSFSIEIERNLFETGGDKLEAQLRSCRALLITTPTVDRLHGHRVRSFLASRGLQARVEVMGLRENLKTLDAAGEIAAHSIRCGLGRNDVLLALGGGVCSDLVGLSASLIRRGIRHIRIPTTLVGQIDAGIGIKSAANFLDRKNYLGAYYPPAAVYVDPTLLETLELDHVRQGLSEIIKIALIGDRRLFHSIETHGLPLLHSRFQAPAALADQVIRRSIALMLGQLRINPYELKTRRLADLGHTISPALEEATGFALPHGEAVSIDMAFSCLLAEELGILSSADARRIIALLMRLGLPVSIPQLTVELCQAALAHAIAHRAGDLNLVVPARIGKGAFLQAPDMLDEARLRRLLARLSALNPVARFEAVPVSARRFGRARGRMATGTQSP